MSYKEGAGGGVSHTPAGLRVRGTGQGTGRMTTGRRLNRTTETKAPTKNHNQIRNAQAMIIGGGRVGGVGAIVCGCCSSGRVYGGCGWTCGRESRVVGRRASQSVCSVQCCRCVGRRVVLGVVSCWASCSRVVLQPSGLNILIDIYHALSEGRHAECLVQTKAKQENSNVHASRRGRGTATLR